MTAVILKLPEFLTRVSKNSMFLKAIVLDYFVLHMKYIKLMFTF